MESRTPRPPHRSQAACPGAKLRERRSAWRGRLLPPLGAARLRRAFLIHGLWFLVFAVAYVLAAPHPVLAAPGDWTLVCPQGNSSEPQFRDQRGTLLPILAPGERAIAARACNLSVPAAANVNVTVTNSGANTIYVAFTNYSTQQPGQITWMNCSVVNNQVVIAGGNTTCNASVPTTAGMTRFCAFTSQVPTGKSPN